MLNKIAWLWGPIWYYWTHERENLLSAIFILALGWMLIKGFWVLTSASVRLAAMGL